jgi:hypothetical protein
MKETDNSSGKVCSLGVSTRRAKYDGRSIANKLKLVQSREEAIKIISDAIVSQIGKRRADEVFMTLNGIVDGGCKDSWWGSTLRVEKIDSKEAVSDVSNILKKSAGDEAVACVAYEAMCSYDVEMTEILPVAEERKQVDKFIVEEETMKLPFRKARSIPSKLKGLKKASYQGTDINQDLLDYQGIQTDGYVDRSKKQIEKGKHAVSANGVGISHVGDCEKHVETAAFKRKKLAEWSAKPISTSLVGLALVFGKTMPKSFFLNALQTVHIFKDEFNYTFEEFMGLRWFSLSVDSKSNTGFVLQYQRSVDCVSMHLKRLKVMNEEYLCLSTLIDKLYGAITCPFTNRLYSAMGNEWMVRYPKPQSFKDKVNQCTEYVHLAYIVVRYIFLHRFPSMDASEFVFQLFQSCKQRKSMAYSLFDLICLYPNKESVQACGKLELYFQNPRMCLDDIRTRNGRNVGDVILELERRMKEMLNNSKTKSGMQRMALFSDAGTVSDAGEYLLVSYKVCKNWLMCGNSKDVKAPVGASICMNGGPNDPFRERTEAEETEIEKTVQDVEDAVEALNNVDTENESMSDSDDEIANTENGTRTSVVESDALPESDDEESDLNSNTLFDDIENSSCEEKSKSDLDNEGSDVGEEVISDVVGGGEIPLVVGVQNGIEKEDGLLVEVEDDADVDGETQLDELENKNETTKPSESENSVVETVRDDDDLQSTKSVDDDDLLEKKRKDDDSISKNNEKEGKDAKGTLNGFEYYCSLGPSKFGPQSGGPEVRKSGFLGFCDLGLT